jgi:hypothetical protein
LDVGDSVRELIAPIGQFHPILSAAQCLKIEERMEGTPKGKPASTSKFETIYLEFHPLNLFFTDLKSIKSLNFEFIEIKEDAKH